MSTNVPSDRLTWTEQDINPTKRAKDIRDAIDNKKIKLINQTKETDEILALLDEIVALDKKQAS